MEFNKLFLQFIRLFYMRKIFSLTILCSFFTFLGICQDSKNEIGIGLFKFRHSAPNQNAPLIPFIGMGSRDTKSSLKGKTIALPDIYYARLINKTFKLRASFFAYKFKANTSLGEPPYNDLYYTRTKVGLSLGVQQNFFYTKNWTPYIAFDLFGIYDSIQHHSIPTPWPVWGFSLEESPKHYIDARLSLGFIKHLSKKYSISSETAIMIREETAFPISRLSINYHF